IRDFSFERVQASPAQFDRVKLAWINGEHMRRLPEADRIADHRADLAAHGLWTGAFDETYLRQVLRIMEDRIKLFSDTANQTAYFFTDDFPWDDKAVRKRLLKPGAFDLLDALRERWAALPAFDAASLEAALKSLAGEHGWNPGDLIHPARVAVSGCSAGPGLYQMLETLGRDRALARLGAARARWSGHA
ncbi:MAG: glutamate--tRNA ligase, partial [Kiritimatiellae bacterium]|nr:glutamate--tRNA ligase [Kiritimatiellia bacterium]